MVVKFYKLVVLKEEKFLARKNEAPEGAFFFAF